MSTARNVNYAASVKQYYTVPDEEKAKYAKKIYDALRVIIDKFNFENHTRVAIKLFILDAEQELSCPSIIFNDADKVLHGEMLLPKIYQEAPLFFKRLHNVKYQDQCFTDEGVLEIVYWEDVILHGEV